MPDTPDKLPSKSRKNWYGDVYQHTRIFATDIYGKVSEANPQYVVQPVYGLQVTATEGHQWPRSNAYPGEDVGGPFETTNRYLSISKFADTPLKMDNLPVHYLIKKQGASEIRLRTTMLPAASMVNANGTQPYATPQPSSNLELIALGTKAIALTKPTNSIANLSVSLAELMREGLPKHPGRSQWEERTRVAKGAGSEYLNAQFGWLPLVSDIQDVTKAISQGDKLWKAYERNAGKLVRRRFEFPTIYTGPEVISVQSTGAIPQPSPSTQFFAAGFTGGVLTRTRFTRKRRWFSGAFTYYLPERDESSAISRLFSDAARARYLYGLTLDPEVLWNLTPWSWAADWFVNTGDVISNLSDFATDGLLLRYGYMMEETIISDEYTLSGLRWSSTPPGPGSITVYANTKTLKRVKATPYGFGLTFSGFSPRQLAIIAALGVTRK